jgi:glycosyltransferase involved in cell wall biosynthesis
VSIDATAAQEPVDGLEPGFWLTVARGRGYKNVAAVIEGVQRAGGQQLAVVGSPAPGYISSPGVRWLGVVSDAQLRWLYGHARALVSVSNEDFGLTPLEANAMGTPVAVLRAGGFLDSLAEGRSGVWIEAATPAAVEAALRGFPEFCSDDVRAHADRFSVDSFAERLRTVLKSVAEAR